MKNRTVRSGGSREVRWVRTNFPPAGCGGWKH